MIKIAITGNIASGKSAVEKILEEKGFIVFDTDKISHHLLENNKKVIEAFADYNILTNNAVDRIKLGEIVFNDNEKLRLLESILHPEIKNEIFKIFEKYNSEKIIFISVPQLFEAHFENIFDKIIIISAHTNKRHQRLMQRSHLSEKEAWARIHSQIPEEDKFNKCDYVLENNSTVEDLRTNLEEILSKIY